MIFEKTHTAVLKVIRLIAPCLVSFNELPTTQDYLRECKVTNPLSLTQVTKHIPMSHLCSHTLRLTGRVSVGIVRSVGLRTVKRLIIDLHRYGTALYDTMETVLNLRHDAHDSVVVSLFSWIIFSVLSSLARIQGKRLLVR